MWLRIACRGQSILAAAWWITCISPTHPGLHLTLPGRHYHVPRAWLLHQQFAERHPTDCHDHLLALGAVGPHRRKGIATRYITDPYLSGEPRARHQPRYLIYPAGRRRGAGHLCRLPAHRPGPDHGHHHADAAFVVAGHDDVLPGTATTGPDRARKFDDLPDSRAALVEENDKVKRKGILRTVTAAAAAIAMIAVAGPAQAAGDTWTYAATHVGDICTVPGVSVGSCWGSASFVHDGDHLYIWDNHADGHSVVVVYYRSDTGSQINMAWNHYGAGTRLDRNMDIPESGWISYKICLGEYASSFIIDWTCSSYKTEDAA